MSHGMKVCIRPQKNHQGGEVMRGLFAFLASNAGRVTRVVAGVALILIGLFVVEGTIGWVLAVVGLVPLLAGVFDFCVFSPLAGLPFVGSKLREELQKPE
jgi:hypothetical protein